MNLNNNPTIEELKQIISRYNDNITDHILWVDNNDEVHITPLPEDLTPAGWTSQNREFIKMRFETFMQGNGYVGETASQDNNWMKRLFNGIIQNWEQGFRGYIDNF